ncbi:MAG TPA: hypothetical protein VF120_16020, partial [Ktedonobacterales bacterium]
KLTTEDTEITARILGQKARDSMLRHPNQPAQRHAMRIASGRVLIAMFLAFVLGVANLELYHLPFQVVAPWVDIMVLAGIEMFVLVLAVREWELAAYAPFAMWTGFMAAVLIFGIVNGYVSGPYYWGSTIEFAADMLVVQLAPAFIGAVLGMSLITALTSRRAS